VGGGGDDAADWEGPPYVLWAEGAEEAAPDEESAALHLALAALPTVDANACPATFLAVLLLRDTTMIDSDVF